MKNIAFFMIMTLFSTLAVAQDGYVAVDPSEVQTIDGAKLMIASYSIVLGMLLFYWIYMVMKTKRLNTQLSNLTTKINSE